MNVHLFPYRVLDHVTDSTVIILAYAHTDASPVIGNLN